MFMIWRYPKGFGGTRIEERSIHGTAPDWVPRVMYKDKERILLNDAPTLVWAATQVQSSFMCHLINTTIKIIQPNWFSI